MIVIGKTMYGTSTYFNIEEYLCSGNKSDLTNLREVDPEEAHYLAEQHDMLTAMETSAKDATNIENAFVTLAKVLKDNYAKALLEEHGQNIVLTSGSNVSSFDYRRITNCCR